MTTAQMLAPTPAESIRTACMRVAAATLVADGVKTPDEPVTINPVTINPVTINPVTINMVHLFDTQAFLLVPTSFVDHLAGADNASGLTAMVEITDWAPIALREPVRALIWLNGSLHNVPAGLERDLAVEIADEHAHPHLLDVGYGNSLLRMQLDHAVIANSSGAACAAAYELANAEPDPFWEYETHWLAHLDHDHRDLIGALARRVPSGERQGQIRPLGIDRYGVRLRVEGTGPDTDIRLPFPTPVDDVCGLSHALRAMAGCPYLNSIPHFG